jgi:hypothetical protein
MNLPAKRTPKKTGIGTAETDHNEPNASFCRNNEAGTTDDDSADDMEKAVRAASAFAATPTKEKDKKVSFFGEGRASGLLKHASHALSRRASGSSHTAGSQTFAADKSDDEMEKKKPPSEPKSKKKKRLADRIIVTEDETPARRLVLKMLDLQDQLEAVNNKI